MVPYMGTNSSVFDSGLVRMIIHQKPALCPHLTNPQREKTEPLKIKKAPPNFLGGAERTRVLLLSVRQQRDSYPWTKIEVIRQWGIVRNPSVNILDISQLNGFCLKVEIIEKAGKTPRTLVPHTVGCPTQWAWDERSKSFL